MEHCQHVVHFIGRYTQQYRIVTGISFDEHPSLYWTNKTVTHFVYAVIDLITIALFNCTRLFGES